MPLSPNDIVIKAPADRDVYGFDYTDYLEGAEIQTSTFALAPGSDAALTLDNAAVLAGNKKATVRVNAGTLAADYTVVHHIVTNESPAREKDTKLRFAVR